MNTDTPPQPAHGEPWTKQHYNAPIGDTGDYEPVIEIYTKDNAMRVAEVWNPEDEHEQAFDRAIFCVNKLMFHPDLSAVEVHSKETMDEVRAALEQMARRTNKGFTGCVYCNYVEEAGHSDDCLIKSALAKLNPPQ